MNKAFKTWQRVAILVDSAVLVMWVCNGVYRLRTGVTVDSYAAVWVALICFIILAIYNLYCVGKHEQRISNAWAFADDIANKYKVLNEAWRQTALRLKAQVPHWIPVTERLPETKGTYLVCGEHWISGSEPITTTCYWSGGRWDKTKVIEIAYWMPMPEWPEEEEHEP